MGCAVLGAPGIVLVVGFLGWSWVTLTFRYSGGLI